MLLPGNPNGARFSLAYFCPARFPLTLFGDSLMGKVSPQEMRALLRALLGLKGIPVDSLTVVEIDSEHLEWFLRCFLFIFEATNRTKKEFFQMENVDAWLNKYSIIVYTICVLLVGHYQGIFSKHLLLKGTHMIHLILGTGGFGII